VIFAPGYTPVARLGNLPKHLLSVGLILSLVLPVLCLRRSSRSGRREIVALAALALFAFPAAIMHSLSVPSFRWTYDNNPLIVVALGALCLLGLRTAQLLLPRRRPAFVLVVMAAAAMLQFTLWSTSMHTVRRLEQCTVSWPEVDYLRGARLPRAAEPLRELVPLVRRLAPSPGDTVLVLPNDPDLEAWFDRRRPQLSSAIVFVDQYWERYVDADFERIVSHPPKVIVVAPRYWGPFMQKFWGGNERGAHRLTMRVILDLMVPHYEHVATLDAPFVEDVRGGEDFVDVWVRKQRGRAVAPRGSAGARRGSGGDAVAPAARREEREPDRDRRHEPAEGLREHHARVRTRLDQEAVQHAEGDHRERPAAGAAPEQEAQRQLGLAEPHALPPAQHAVIAEALAEAP
jgi:hypothetical protein